MIGKLKREFKIGDRVLLYNFRFKFSAGKLVSKWQGPLVIQDIYPSGAIRPGVIGLRKLMMLCGHIELLLRTQLACLLIKWCMVNLVIF